MSIEFNQNKKLPCFKTSWFRHY